jgi:HPt (histidine-containing phosphotransfer) domain-containing protein
LVCAAGFYRANGNVPNRPPPNPAIAELAQGLGLEDARELVGMFLKGFEPTLAGLDSPDREEQRRAAHSLKSSARIVGLLELSHFMEEIEDRLGRASGAVAPGDLAAARKLFAAGSGAMRTFAGSAGS